VTATGAWQRCSYVADEAGDPREGTAPPADRWFLVEHPGPWGRFALTQSGMDPTAVGVLSAWAASEVDSRPGHESVRTGTFTAEAELAAAVHAPGEEYDGPLLLICTHGRHDTCCAVRGRPLAEAIAAVEPDRTWECSHVGGCRFAPALVLLPHGYALGGVPPDAGPAVVRTYRDGEVEPRWLRGRSSLPPAVQAAQHHARLATGALGVDALRPVDVAADGDIWRVRLTDPDITVLLRERRVETGRPLTCAATAPGWMRVFDLLEITTPAQR
jgi:hypothetical protein